jgi:hypothetical protein
MRRRRRKGRENSLLMVWQVNEGNQTTKEL